jgi:hypothetical protein
MKKIILTAVAVFAFSFANAQDLKSKKGEPFLPEAGDWGISFQANNLFSYVGNAFNGAGSNGIGAVANPNSSGSFTGKKFKTANQADRYTVGFAAGTSSDTDASDVTTKMTVLNLEVGIGKEWRRGKTRLQGFYGYDLIAGLNLIDSEKIGSAAAVKQGVGFNVGAQGFLGAEYFIFPKMAIGASYTYGVNIGIQGSASGSKEKSSGVAIGNVGVSAISLSLHF